MYRMLILLGFLVSVYATSDVYKEGSVQIKSMSDNDGMGSYRFSYEQSDGTNRVEEGNVINLGTDDETIIVKGTYSWIGPDNVGYIINYVADDKGFQPTIEQGPGIGLLSPVVASLLS